MFSFFSLISHFNPRASSGRVCQAFRRSLGFLDHLVSFVIVFYTCLAILELSLIVFQVICTPFAWISFCLVQLRSHSLYKSFTFPLVWKTALVFWELCQVFIECFLFFIWCYCLSKFNLVHSAIKQKIEQNLLHSIVNWKKIFSLICILKRKVSFEVPLAALGCFIDCVRFVWGKILNLPVVSIHRTKWYLLACSLHLGNCERSYGRTWNQNIIEDQP